MRLRLEASPTELTEKSHHLIERLASAIAPYNGALAESLEKALINREDPLKYPMMQELAKRTQDLYQEHLDSMLRDIGKVLEGRAKKSMGAGDADVFETRDLRGEGGVPSGGDRDSLDLLDEDLRQSVLHEGLQSLESLRARGMGGEDSSLLSLGEGSDSGEEFGKAGGPYIGPKGGLWADPEHTQHWDPNKPHGEGGEGGGAVTSKPKEKEEEDESSKRYPDDVALQKLIEMGDLLYGLQTGMHNVQDDTGFNHYDYGYWHQVRGNLWGMRKMLAKYKGQISGNFGAKEYTMCGLGDPPPATGIYPVYHDTFGSLLMPVNGKVAKAAFDKYLAINQYYKAKGFLTWDGNHKTWFVPVNKVDEFPFAEYVQKMAEIGIEVHAPKGTKKAVKQTGKEADGVVKTLSADELIQGIKNKQVKSTLVVKRQKDGTFSFYFPFNTQINDLFSNKAGNLTGITKYNPVDHSRETFDLDLVEEALEKLKNIIPDWNVVTDGVKEARIEKDKYTAELQQPIPEVAEKLDPKFKLYPYQNECVRFLDKADGNALIGDEMGLGKTLETLAWAAKGNKRVIVVCPKVVRRTWLQEAEKFFPGHFKGRELVSSDLLKGNIPDLSDLNIVTINYESLEKFRPILEKAGFDTVIIDESHRMKNPKAKSTKSIQALVAPMKHKILLSGTAVKNKKDELFTQLGLVAPGKFSKQFLQTGTIGGLWMDMRDVYLARQKSLVLKDLPEKVTTIISHPIKADVPDIHEGMGIGEFSAMKAAIAKAKVPATMEVVQEILDSSDSRVVVFTDSVEAAKEFAEKLGDQAILHHGGMKDDDREAAKAEFQKQDAAGNFISTKRVFVTTRQSMAVGATLTAADKVVFNDLPWTAADVRQAEDRCHRVGQKNAVNVYWSTVQGNLFDENVADILRRKYELNQKVNQGKQLTKEEIEWMNKPVTPEEIMAQIAGKAAGPKPSEEPTGADVPAPDMVPEMPPSEADKGPGAKVAVPKVPVAKEVPPLPAPEPSVPEVKTAAPAPSTLTEDTPTAGLGTVVESAEKMKELTPEFAEGKTFAKTPTMDSIAHGAPFKVGSLISLAGYKFKVLSIHKFMHQGKMRYEVGLQKPKGSKGFMGVLYENGVWSSLVGLSGGGESGVPGGHKHQTLEFEPPAAATPPVKDTLSFAVKKAKAKELGKLSVTAGYMSAAENPEMVKLLEGASDEQHSELLQAHSKGYAEASKQLAPPPKEAPKPVEPVPPPAPKAPAGPKPGSLDHAVITAGGEIRQDPVHEHFILVRVPVEKPEAMASIQDEYELLGKVKHVGDYLQIAVPREVVKAHLTNPEEQFKKSIPFEGVEIIYSSSGADQGGAHAGAGNGGAGVAGLGAYSSGGSDGAPQVDDGELWPVSHHASLAKAGGGKAAKHQSGGAPGVHLQNLDSEAHPGSGSAASGAFYDFTKPIVDKESSAYQKMKQLIINRGAKSEDFEEGGVFFGWSVNQLADYVRVAAKKPEGA